LHEIKSPISGLFIHTRARGELLTVIVGAGGGVFVLNPELYRNKLFMFLCCELPCKRTRLIRHETRKRYTNENDDVTRDSRGPSDISGVVFAPASLARCCRRRRSGKFVSARPDTFSLSELPAVHTKKADEGPIKDSRPCKSEVCASSSSSSSPSSSRTIRNIYGKTAADVNYVRQCMMLVSFFSRYFS
jgi:hypothetical protein